MSSCQSGVWKAATGSGKLTHYNQLPPSTNAGLIMTSNPMPGICSPIISEIRFDGCFAIPPGQCIPCDSLENGAKTYSPRCEDGWRMSNSVAQNSGQGKTCIKE